MEDTLAECVQNLVLVLNNIHMMGNTTSSEHKFPCDFFSLLLYFHFKELHPVPSQKV